MSFGRELLRFGCMLILGATADGDFGRSPILRSFLLSIYILIKVKCSNTRFSIDFQGRIFTRGRLFPVYHFLLLSKPKRHIPIMVQTLRRLQARGYSGCIGGSGHKPCIMESAQKRKQFLGASLAGQCGRVQVNGILSQVGTINFDTCGRMESVTFRGRCHCWIYILLAFQGILGDEMPLRSFIRVPPNFDSCFSSLCVQFRSGMGAVKGPGGPDLVT